MNEFGRQPRLTGKLDVSTTITVTTVAVKTERARRGQVVPAHRAHRLRPHSQIRTVLVGIQPPHAAIATAMSWASAYVRAATCTYV